MDSLDSNLEACTTSVGLILSQDHPWLSGWAHAIDARIMIVVVKLVNDGGGGDARRRDRFDRLQAF